MEDRIFTEEQQHLTDVYNRLSAMESALDGRAREIAVRTPEEKKAIRENLTLNFDGSADTMETYIEFEVMNHVIDQYNIENEAVQEKLSRVRQLLKKPYFARVTLRFPDEESPEDFYIGSTAVSENNYDHLVIDWRSPVAETYYNQENGRTSYEVDGRRIPVELLLRRQFSLDKNVLHAYFDTQIALEDPLLIASLSETRTDHMQAITATIQKEQNEVIRCPEVSALLVNGIAGSGKTSVLLQRIAFLFFRRRRTLRPEDVYIMTLNPVFRRYIAEVLPDMGERNPNTITGREFLAMVGVPGGIRDDSTSADSLRRIDRLLPALTLEKGDFRPVVQKDITVLSARQIAAVVNSFDHIPVGARLIQVSIDELLERAKAIIRRRLRGEGARDSQNKSDTSAGFVTTGDGGPGERGQASAVPNHSITRERRPSAEENRIENEFGGAYRMIRKCGYLDINSIGCRLLGKTHLSATEYFYLKMALTGECDRNARYVCIDEVQDYELSQLMMYKRYFVNARFMLLGDEYQAIRPGTVRFDEIRDLFGGTAVSASAKAGAPAGAAVSAQSPVSAGGAGNSSFREFPLMTSYRSSPEITALFTRLMPQEKQIAVSSVQRPGIAPVIRAFDRQEYKKALRELLSAGGTAGQDGNSQDSAGQVGNGQVGSGQVGSGQVGNGLTAVICVNRESCGRIASLLGNDAPPVLGRGDALPESGTILLDLPLAKGLEFDSVILPDADEAHYPDTELGRHRLYTALSRATKRLTVLAEGALTPLIIPR